MAVDCFGQCADVDYYRLYPRLRTGNRSADAVAAYLARRVEQLARTPSDADGAVVGLVAAVCDEIAGSALRAFDPDEAAVFAHSAGLHPAYLWPEALPSHEYYTALGWLGHFQRQSCAPIPDDVRDYFRDVLACAPDGTVTSSDPALRQFLPTPTALRSLWNALNQGRRPLRARVPAESCRSRHRSFAVNGRFFSQRISGVQRYAREIVSAMDALLTPEDAPVRLLTPPNAEAVPAFRHLEVEITGRGISRQLWEQTSLAAAAGSPSLHLCNTAPAIGRDQVICIHDANVFIEPESYSPAFRTYYRLLQPWIARRAAKVATVSHHAASQLARHLGVPTSAMVVLPNGHEHALRWDASRASLLKRWAPRRPFVLLLASQAPHKNVRRITGLAAALDALGLDVVVAGRRSPIFAPVEAVSGVGVVWLGTVDDDDLAFLYRNALCLAFPSLTEGFGLPVVEAMALGCPVISSDRASLPEVCGGAALMADPERDEPWITHLAALAGSRALADDLRGRGSERVRAYTWARSAQGYLDLFAS